MRDITKAEHEILDLLGLAYVRLHELRPAHPYDLEEFAVHIHAAQNVILARPGTEVISKDSKKRKV